MQHFKTLFFYIIALFILILGLSSCNSNYYYEQQYPALIKKPAPNTSYYPYLSLDQYIYFHRQNFIGLIPGTILIPSHEKNALEYLLNANSWWGSWPSDILFMNFFIAEKAKQILGCGPLKEGTTITIPHGIYTYKQKKVSLAIDLSWRLATDLPTMCLTKSYLEKKFYENDSMYWSLPYSQNRIFP